MALYRGSNTLTSCCTTIHSPKYTFRSMVRSVGARQLKCAARWARGNLSAPRALESKHWHENEKQVDLPQSSGIQCHQQPEEQKKAW